MKRVETTRNVRLTPGPLPLMVPRPAGCAYCITALSLEQLS